MVHRILGWKAQSGRGWSRHVGYISLVASGPPFSETTIILYSGVWTKLNLHHTLYMYLKLQPGVHPVGGVSPLNIQLS